MLTASRSFALNAESAPKLPMPADFQPVWDLGATLRQGELVMVVGRSGSGKSAFALNLAAKMNVPTLYCSGDMSPFDSTSRLAAMLSGQSVSDIEEAAKNPSEMQRYVNMLDDLPITFSFGNPIGFHRIDFNLDAYVELHNEYPAVIIIDNLMDLDEGTDSDYTVQMAAMQKLTALARETNAMVVVLAHATDKSDRASTEPGIPAGRREVKNGLSEKPALALSVALWNDPAMPHAELRVAVIKNRTGPSDPSGGNYARLLADPEHCSFRPLANYHRKEG